MDCCGLGHTFAAQPWIWGTPLASVGAMLAGEVESRGSTEAARTAETTAAALAVLRETQGRRRLAGGGKWIRTIGPPPEIVVDPSGSHRDHRAKYGCLSARPRVRCLCPPGKTQHLLPKSVFGRPGSDRWNLASTTFPDAGPMVRIRFPPAASHARPVRTH